MGKSDYLENLVLTTYVVNAVNLFLAYHTLDPGDTGLNETPNLARTSVSGKFAAAAGGATSSNVDILSAAATADVGNVTHLSLWDASVAGNLLWHGPATVVRNVLSGDQYRVPSGQLTVTET